MKKMIFCVAGVMALAFSTLSMAQERNQDEVVEKEIKPLEMDKIEKKKFDLDASRIKVPNNNGEMLKVNHSMKRFLKTFESACSGKVELKKDGSFKCVLPWGGKAFDGQTFVELTNFCKTINGGVYPLSVGIQQLNKCSTPSITLTCPSRLGAKESQGQKPESKANEVVPAVKD